MEYPSVEYRLLGAFRVGAVIRYFFPYKHLMGEDWDSVLVRSVSNVEDARNALEYHLAVAEMVSHIHDSHGCVVSPVLDRAYATKPRVMVRMIENVPVITAVRDEQIAKTGIEVGDVILKIDGEDVQKRIDFFAKYVAASTPPSAMFKIANMLLSGPEKSRVALTIRTPDDRIKEVAIQRTEKQEGFTMWNGKLDFGVQRTGQVLASLPGNVGYADLDRLPRERVEELFVKFRDTKAIVFDMRGYPHETGDVIAQRLAEKPFGGGRNGRLIVMSPDSQARESKLGQFPLSDKPKYRGKTVLLIDERAISASETIAMWLKSANGTTYIGSSSAGADASVTGFRVLGGIQVYFTGEEMTHDDGRQLQRIGLLPDVEVKPTINGIREGRDEVLEKALEFLGVKLTGELKGVGEAR